MCLRSARTGRSAFFASGDELAPQLALDAALSFAERLGFLFDDDEVALRGEEAALRLWEELCGDAATAPARPDADDLDDSDEAPWRCEPFATAPEAPTLSKFRFAAGRA